MIGHRKTIIDVPKWTFYLLAWPLLLAEKAFYWLIVQEKKKPRKKYPEHGASVKAHARRIREDKRCSHG